MLAGIEWTVAVRFIILEYTTSFISKIYTVAFESTIANYFDSFKMI